MRPTAAGRSAPIRMLDLSGEIDELWDPIMEALQRVLRSGQFILGPEVTAFEHEVADYLGVAHAVAVNSGTDALVIGLEAAGVGPGDEVVTTPFTFFATVEAIARLGATPVFADIGPTGFDIDPRRIADAVTPRTTAVLPVHLFGEPAAMDAIMAVAREHGLKVIEDCAQSFGAVVSAGADAAAHAFAPRTGAVGDVGAFSFYPSKNLGAYGDAGLIATNDAAIAERAVALRNHGARAGRRYEHASAGYNSRMDELQAAILRIKLPRVDAWNGMRREIALRYDRLLGGLEGVSVPPRTPGHVYHQYTVRLSGERRARVLEALDASGIASSVFYPRYETAWPEKMGRDASGCPRARAASDEVVSLPMHPRLSAEEQERVSEVIRTALV